MLAVSVGLTGLLAIATGCELPPAGYVHPGVPGVYVVKSEDARRAAASQEVRPELLIVSAAEAEAQGLEAQTAFISIGEDQDGTKLLVDLLEKARARGARVVSDVSFYFVTTQEGSPVECRVAIQPADAVTMVKVPAQFRQVPVMTPVTRTVTEYTYRCHPRPKTVTRSETRSQYRCRMVTVPVTRMETTYTSQYDFSSKSTRTVPQTRSVTRYESRNQCGSEPVTQMVTRTEMGQECGMEPVTRTVTRYEFQLQTRFVPPHLESVQTKKLVSSEPVCYAPVEGELPARGNRLEAKIYLPRRR